MKNIIESQQRLFDKLYYDLGEKIISCLQDPDVNEIMLNPNGELWIDTLKSGSIHVGNLNSKRATAILNTVAGIHSLTISAQRPRLESFLPYFSAMKGERFIAAIPPIVAAPCFTIRKYQNKIYSLEDYARVQKITSAQLNILQQLIRQRKNILICGGPGSGKTTFTNTLISEIVKISPQHRLLILEDLPELQCPAGNCVSMLTAESVTMRNLVQAAMRMRPDRIIIGEVRGSEALELLKAWNTGCPGGVSTIHANHAEAAVQRIADLAMEAGLTAPPWSLLKCTLDVVVFINRRGQENGFIEEMLAIKGEKHDKLLLEKLA